MWEGRGRQGGRFEVGGVGTSLREDTTHELAVLILPILLKNPRPRIFLADPFVADWATIGQNLIHFVVFERRNATLEGRRRREELRSRGSDPHRAIVVAPRRRYDDRAAAEHLLSQAVMFFRERRVVFIAPNDGSFLRAAEHCGLDEEKEPTFLTSSATRNGRVNIDTGVEDGVAHDVLKTPESHFLLLDSLPTFGKDGRDWAMSRRVYAGMHML